ncbi:MAG TPA: chlorite dismutase family protein, partial [Ktedonobacterales bacterium]|nr:chlorite dismutase family protein [Ktedonobacterales bacterium]
MTDATKTTSTTDTKAMKKIYSIFWLYRVDPDFHRLPAAQQAKGKQEFLAALEARAASVTLRASYSLVGLRNNADLMFWAWGESLEDLQRLAVTLRQSGLGRYLAQVETYLGVTAAPRYDPEHGPAFTSGAAPKNYVSVYPFVKTTEWFLLPYEERRMLMAEHGQVGRHYAVPRAKLLAEAAGRASNGAHAANGGTGGNGAGHGVATATRSKAKAAAATQTTPETTVAGEAVAEVEEGGGILSNTVDAFALGDYEFILANESDDPDELCRMMMALRATEVRRYTRLDTPIYLGRLRSPADALA